MMILTVEQLKEARIKCLSNAKELIADASLLFANKRWGRSLYLCQIASEEIGKYWIICTAIMDTIADRMDWRRFWKAYRSHKTKTKVIVLLETLALSKDYPKDELENLRRIVDGYRQGGVLAIYSDFLEGRFWAPSDLIDESLASKALTIANGRLRLTGW
jgi:AbiV family abortive infection protein